MTPRILLAALAPAALLAGCATPSYVSPVEVTRFVGAQPAALGSGRIAVRAAPGTAADSWDYAPVQRAVAAELAQLGYTVGDDSPQQVAEMSIRRLVQPAAVGARSPVSVGVGGSTGSYGSGVGVGVGINLGGGGRQSDRIDSELRVVIRPSGGGDALWEGRARFVASDNSAFANPQAAAERLADALFSGFPGRSGETIEVE